MGHEHAIVSSPHQGKGVITPTMQTTDSQAEPLPPTSPTGAACIAPSLPKDPFSNDMPLLSISLRLNGMQADLCQQPHLCDEARILASEFLDQALTVQDLMLALKQPRPRKSMLSFLRFVFESSPLLDELALDRKLKLRKIDSISLVLCSATYTEKMILNFPDGRFRALLSTCCKFLGDPGNVAASLPVEVVAIANTAKIVPEDHKAYSIFLRGLEEYHRAHKATPPSLLLRGFTRAERPFGFEASMTWPQEHVAALLCVKG
ncbi:hypothetical protein F5883DRAFT_144757 [Diaporthe sp. PMI_573]|nr:hypothetical protein F5883DRAFT_144757 [Diaporthaceae sp. PMI_573]